MKCSSNISKFWLTLIVLLGVVSCGEDNTETIVGESSGKQSANNPVTQSKQSNAVKIDLAKVCPDPSQTVVGLCIGMSVEEAEAAIKEQLPNTQISYKRGSFRYSDGVQQLSSETYVSQLFAENDSTDEGYEIFFTAPPGEPRAMMIKRWQGSDGANFPPIEGYLKAMIDKYGEPQLQKIKPQGTLQRAVIRWLFPSNGTNCAQNPETDDLLVGLNLNPTIDHAARMRESGLDPNNCATVLQAQLYAPAEDVSVTSVQVYFSDLAMGAKASADTISWLETLEKDARQARLQNAEAPKL